MDDWHHIKFISLCLNCEIHMGGKFMQLKYINLKSSPQYLFE